MKVYLVGGACRDMLMGFIPKDYDFVVVGATPQNMIDLGYKQVGKDFPVFLEPTHGWEIALARTERKTGIGYGGFETEWNGVTLEEDLARRDLTINAIAMEVNWSKTVKTGELVHTGKFIDPFKGKDDLKNRLLKPTTEAFKEDPVRVLRVVRFLSRYTDFKVDSSLCFMCKDVEYSGELNNLVPDRVWKETEKALGEKDPSRYFEFLVNFNFSFSGLFLEMESTVENNLYHQESNVFVHTMMVLRESNRLGTNDKEINFAALLHDIAKPTCYQQRGNAHGHDNEGVSMIEDFCKEWKVPNSYRDLAKIVCEQHQKIHSCMGRGNNKPSKAKSIMKMFEQSGAINNPERFKKVLIVWEADNLGRISVNKTEDYLPKKYLLQCLYAVLSVDNKEISSRMVSQGKQGILIGEAIRVARISAIREVQNKWKN